MNVNQISIFIPDSFLAETKDLKLKTYKTGLIARALAVFRVNRVIVYKDSLEENYTSDADFICDILAYMETPQYLRKLVFPLKEELKHVGILPPLRTPNHPSDEELNIGDFRQGFTLKRNKKGTFVDIGADKLAFCKEQLTVKKVFSFKVIKIGKEILLEPDTPVNDYWGYDVLNSNKNLMNSLKQVKPDTVFATSRLADPINLMFDDLEYKIKNSKHTAIVFGGPYSGLVDSLDSPYWDTISINTIPEQGTKTVRTEEAVTATLSIVNLLRGSE